MKNNNIKFTKIDTEEISKDFYPVPITLTKEEYKTFKEYDEDLIAKIIGCSIMSVDKNILKNTKGIKIQLVIKC